PNYSALGGGFSLTNGTYTDLGLAPSGSGWNVRASGVNDADSIVGIYSDDNGLWQGVSLSNGIWTTLHYPGTSAWTEASGINNAGTIVGWCYDANGVQHGFSLSNGIYTLLDYPGWTGYTAAAGINNAGTIVGSYSQG